MAERFRDFMKVVFTLTQDEFVEQFPHPFLFYSERGAPLADLGHTRLVDNAGPSGPIDRFSEQVLDFLPLLPSMKTQREFPKKIFIGRDPRRDLVVSHTTVSSRHACLFFDEADGCWKLVDSGSTNGTFVGTRTLRAGEPVALQDGDVVSFGKMSFLFLTPAGAYRFMRQYRAFRDALKD